jgi:hypothetical protein
LFIEQRAYSVGSFFRQHIGAIPNINPHHWSFSISGSVRQPLSLTFQDLHTLPSVEVPATIACAGRGNLLGHALWRGVPLQSLLDQLDILSPARYASVVAADGAPLSPEHGFPARLIAPGLSGYKMPKWVTHIRLSDALSPGYWETRGGTLDGAAGVTAVILDACPQDAETVVISGIAYAGERALSQVEINVDDSPWMPVSFVDDAPHSRAQWQTTWTTRGRGDYLFRVRATDSSARQSDPHAVVIRIR